MLYKFEEKLSINFTLQNSLIHYEKNSNSKLYISTVLEKKMFKMIHDDNIHENQDKILKRIKHVFYIKHLSKHFVIYIKYYFKCLTNQIKRHKSYKMLNLIFTSIKLYHIIIMNWIMTLSLMLKDHNILFTIMNKFSWKVLLISDNLWWKVNDWARKILM